MGTITNLTDEQFVAIMEAVIGQARVDMESKDVALADEATNWLGKLQKDFARQQNPNVEAETERMFGFCFVCQYLKFVQFTTVQYLKFVNLYDRLVFKYRV